MRRTVMIVALAFLIASPAGAKTSKYAGSPILGARSCAPTFACPSANNREQVGDITKAVIASANSCIRKFYGVDNSGGFFEDSFGLDANLCLTTQKLKPDATGFALTPNCCVQPVPNTNEKTCQLRCTMYSVKK